jgi:predicted negative regulator of RcsB-dependent stress response
MSNAFPSPGAKSGSSDVAKTVLTPTEAEQVFDPMAFYIKHGAKVRRTVLLAALVFAGYTGVTWMAAQKREAASRAFANATTADALKVFIGGQGDSVIAGNARLALSQKLREAGDLAGSTAVLKEFQARHAGHPMESGALTGLAANLEAEGKADEALEIYRSVSAKFGRSFSAPLALLQTARIHRAAGRVADAKQAYEALQSQFPRSLFAAEALSENQKLVVPSKEAAVDPVKATAPASGADAGADSVDAPAKEGKPAGAPEPK